MILSQRVHTPASAYEADNNIHKLYPIHEGHWICHPDVAADQTSFCRYTLDFLVDTEKTFTLHVSADQRFELYCDGLYVGMGPDRSDTAYWSFHSYEMTVAAGKHTLVAEVSFLHASYPAAQMFLRPAFLLYSGDCPVDINTGTAAWRVSRLAGITLCDTGMPNYHVVGPNYTIHGAEFFKAAPTVEPVIVSAAGNDHSTGCVLPGWKLHPSRLPEQRRVPVGGGRIRAVGTFAKDAPFTETGPDVNAGWQTLLEGGGSLEIPANTRAVALWDLDEYHTAFPEVTLSSGQAASLQMFWAEACYVNKLGVGGWPYEKGNRNTIDGRLFMGYGDTFIADGGDSRVFRSLWWRAGRYIRIVVETADQPLVIEKIRLIETRMPLENQGRFECDDSRLESIIPVAVRGIQMCAHETYMDCPYYEQLMYVGDTRLQVLTSFVMSSEDRLTQRAIELFDWSRRETGFVMERFPSTPAQLSTTFSMIWVLMLNDYMGWRPDADFVRKRIKGLRCLLESFRDHQGDSPLLTRLPGWSFIDWVPEWPVGNAPDGVVGTSCIINLLFLNALQAAVQMEEALGDSHFADYDRAWAIRIAAEIRNVFWDEERGLFADDMAHTKWSEHAQCLALLSGCFQDVEERCLTQLVTVSDLARTTVYFSFYLLEVFARFGRGDLILERLEFWKQMVEQGFRTPVETPEPSRSDCHAWGSHPLFHMHASLAGIRPAAPGFSAVRITPQPGSLLRLHCRTPHPSGEIVLSMEKTESTWQVQVDLPAGVPGTLLWKGTEYPLSEKNRLSLAG